jgi:4'-phosphopantetheinyl transferase
VKEDDRKRALVSRLLQYSLVHHLLHIPFHQINICRTAEGKPYLVCALSVNFSLIPSYVYAIIINFAGFYLVLWSVVSCH